MKILISFFSLIIFNNTFGSEIKCKDCNVILISLTSARPKNMSLYGYKRETTPNLKKFFNESFVYKNAFAPASLTHTDSISLFFSLSTNNHQAFRRGRILESGTYLEKFPTLASVLGKNGYDTMAFVSDEDYEYNWGIGKTFKTYFDRSMYPEYGIRFSPQSYSVGTKQLVPIANKWLEKNKNKKFFLFLQAYDMHCPYGPNEEFKHLFQSPHSNAIPFDSECFMNLHPLKLSKQNGKTGYKLQSFFAYRNQNFQEFFFTKEDLEYLKSRYDAELRKADFYLGSFFEQISKLGLEKNTLIVFMADHGDNLGENNFFMKSSPEGLGNLHSANLNMPLAFKIPGIRNNKKFQNQLIQTIDIAPTILDILTIAPPKEFQGKSFKNNILGDTDINDFLYGFSLRFELEKYGEEATAYYEHDYLIDHNFKYQRSKKYSMKNRELKSEEYYLFDRTKDPEELKNILNKQTKEYYEKIIYLKRGKYSTRVKSQK